MKTPTTNTQEILFTLIQKGDVSLFDFPVMAGFRTRCSDLRLKHGLELETEKKQGKNKFGNTYTYHVHKLKDIEKAKKIYNKVNNSD